MVGDAVDVYNAADEVTAACSLAFDAPGQRLFAGLNNRLCIFDVARPGRYYRNIVPHSRASPGLQGAPLAGFCGHLPMTHPGNIFVSIGLVDVLPHFDCARD